MSRPATPEILRSLNSGIVRMDQAAPQTTSRLPPARAERMPSHSFFRKTMRDSQDILALVTIGG
jgi:hypothetical protein